MYSLFYSIYDILSLLVFLSSWISYEVIYNKKKKDHDNLTTVVNQYRKLWMSEAFNRKAKIVDATIINTLRASASFFASTSLLIVAGLITGIASSEKGVSILSTLPFMNTITSELWEIKMLFLILIFVYAFFEFTWCLRMYNFSCLFVGSTPEEQDIIDTDIKDKFAATSTKIFNMASNHFNFGIKAYYFSLAALTWFISPLLMVILGFIIIYILYRREFKSNTFKVLKEYIDYYESKNNNL
jgi:uncharacterized membrane protein